MSDFVPGFVARHDAAAAALVQAFPLPDFVARDLREAVASSAKAASGPKHFSPQDPGARPTQGWDPLDSSTPAPTPFIDPLEAAHAAGYAEGLAAAAQAAREAEARDAALLTGISGQIGGAQIDREGIAARLRQTVLLLVGKLVEEVGISADILARRVEAAAELLADQAESALLRVHPDDVALLEGKLPKSVFAAGDAGVPRGSFVLESASTVIEDGPEMWLAQLAEAMDKVAVPAGSC